MHQREVQLPLGSAIADHTDPPAVTRTDNIRAEVIPRVSEKRRTGTKTPAVHNALGGSRTHVVKVYWFFGGCRG
jgi:hypothetical protein